MSYKSKIYTAIGLMSGTSLDGVDAAVIYSDGLTKIDYGPAITIDYNSSFRKNLRSIIGQKHYNGKILSIESELTDYHIYAVNKLIEDNSLNNEELDIISFHGQTISHDPSNQHTFQIGDPIKLSKYTKINVINDFRSADINAGGQGAPLVPIFHSACLKNELLPLVVVNIGGVSNVTWIGANESIISFDTGPGNALLNDWVYKKKGQFFDKDGEFSRVGLVKMEIVDKVMESNFFCLAPPKSLDRQFFNHDIIPTNLSLEDGAATAVDLICKSIISSKTHFPIKPNKWLITGGGSKNLSIMDSLKKLIGNEVYKIESVGLNSDFLEAQAFAYLGIRSLNSLPITFPETTGCKKPTLGGVLTKHSLI
ncbi:anhydro-N-acetylmuramic acid kinase [Alphaproteobacteria bacterium]|nr:anhydro-N-acetylmuramic acid kinase [Alphaproteobacteria bacterium]